MNRHIAATVGDWTEGSIEPSPKSPIKFSFEEDWTIEDDEYSYTVCEYSDDDVIQDENSPYLQTGPKSPKSPKSPTRSSRVIIRRRQNSSPRKSSSSDSRQVLGKNPKEFFVKYCTGKLDAAGLVENVVDHVMKSAETAREMAMTLSLVVKDEQSKGIPAVLPALLKNIQLSYMELQSQSNALPLERVLGTVALLCACFECFRTEDDIPMLKPLATPILKSLHILLAYNPDLGSRAVKRAQARSAAALLGHLAILGKTFDDINETVMDSLFNNMRSLCCCRDNSQDMLLALLEAIELRASGWKLPENCRSFYGKQTSAK